MGRPHHHTGIVVCRHRACRALRGQKSVPHRMHDSHWVGKPARIARAACAPWRMHQQHGSRRQRAERTRSSASTGRMRTVTEALSRARCLAPVRERRTLLVPRAAVRHATSRFARLPRALVQPSRIRYTTAPTPSETGKPATRSTDAPRAWPRRSSHGASGPGPLPVTGSVAVSGEIRSASSSRQSGCWRQVP